MIIRGNAGRSLVDCDVTECPFCEQNHDGLTFWPVGRLDPDAHSATSHIALCPVKGLPIVVELVVGYRTPRGGQDSC